ncbi:MAG: chemotaxis protein CheW [Phycisphaerae bacterium]
MSTEPAESQEALLSAQRTSGRIQLVGFRLADEDYCVNIMHVQEVVLIGQITEMPQVPDHVVGLINLRGNVIPVLDLRIRLNLTAAPPTEHTRIVVINVGAQTVGVIVDAVKEVLSIEADQIQPAPAGLCGSGERYISGVVKLESRLLVLLNLGELVRQDTTVGESLDPVAAS